MTKSHYCFPYFFDDDYGFCFGPCGWSVAPAWNLPYDLMIYYGDMGDDDFIGGWCSRWDAQNYDIICETWLKKPTLQSLVSNIRPGAVGILYEILGKPHHYDTSWTAANTIKIKPHPSSNLSNMRSEKIAYVKNLTTHPVTNTDWVEIKLECNISGNTDI